MSGDGEVWISPIHFFSIVARMRESAALAEDLSALEMVDVAHDGGTSYIEALVNAVGEARTMLAASLEVAGRALVLAGTRTVDADMAEERADSFWELDSPYTGWGPDPNDQDRDRPVGRRGQRLLRRSP